MGMCTPDDYREQQASIQQAAADQANAMLAAQYQSMGREPPDFCKPAFIEGEFEVVDEQKLISHE